MKRKFDSDCQLFHAYLKQNEQPLLASKHWTWKCKQHNELSHLTSTHITYWM